MLPDDFESMEESKLHDCMGKVYMSGPDYYILAQIGCGKFTMVNMHTGNRMTDGLETLEDLTDGMVEVPGGRIEVYRSDREVI